MLPENRRKTAKKLPESWQQAGSFPRNAGSKPSESVSG